MGREGGTYSPRLSSSTASLVDLKRHGGGFGGGGTNGFTSIIPGVPDRPMNPPIPPQPTASGGFQSAAGPQGSAVTTPALVAARFNGAIVSNPTQLMGNNVDGQGYVAFDIDRPMILASVTGNMEGVFYYHPDRPPRRDLDANRSVQHGIAYLSNPGRWWVKYSGNAVACDVILHDASDGAVASRYLSEPGTHYTLQTHLTVTAAVTTLLSPNILRKALLIQNLTASNSIRLAFDGQVPQNGGVAPWVGPLGLRLAGATGSVITLAGDTCVKGYVLAILEGGAGSNAEVEITEWI